MRNILFLLFATLPFCFPSLYANLSPPSPTPTFCPPGFRTAVNTENYCVPCQFGTYNHGQMSRGRTKCYPILQREIILANSTAVKCNKYWTGKPIYIDGEYQYGCYDAGEETNTPTAQYSNSPLLCGNCPFAPSKNPTKYPTRYPTRYPTKWPSNFPTTTTPSSAPTKKPSKKKKKPTNYPTSYPTLQPTKAPVIPPPAPVPPHHHTVIINNHDSDKDKTTSTNAYDIGIAAIILLSIILIIVGILCYKKKMKKYRVQQRLQERREMNNRISTSQIELSPYQPDPFIEAGTIASTPYPKRAHNSYPIGKTISH